MKNLTMFYEFIKKWYNIYSRVNYNLKLRILTDQTLHKIIDIEINIKIKAHREKENEKKR